MAYDKLTFASFKTALKDGRYDSATGARRGVGKADFTEEEKVSARKLIDAHFGETSPAAKPAAKKAEKKAEKKVATKVEKKAPAAKKTPAAPAPKAASNKRAPKTAKLETLVQASEVQEQVREIGHLPVMFADFSDPSSVLTQMRIGEFAASMLSSMLNGVTAAQAAFPAAEFAPVAEEIGSALQSSVSIFRHLVDGVKAAQAGSVKKTRAPRVAKTAEVEGTEPEQTDEEDSTSNGIIPPPVSAASMASSIL